MKYSTRHMLTGREVTEGWSKFLADKVLSKMACDEISLIVQGDQTILTVGSQMLEKQGTEKAGEISQKMRLLGRVVKVGRKKEGKRNWNLKHFLKPQEFDWAWTLCGYDENDGSMTKKFLNHQQLLFIVAMN